MKEALKTGSVLLLTEAAQPKVIHHPPVNNTVTVMKQTDEGFKVGYFDEQDRFHEVELTPDEYTVST